MESPQFMTEIVPRIAVIAGGTGLVGRCCLQRLLDDPRYGRVIALTRQANPFEHPKLKWLRTDFDDLMALVPALPADDAYCCLGTTLKRAGSRAAFEHVDYPLVMAFARAAHAAGASRFMVVSAYGANARSLAFYSRVKARMEQAVSDVGYSAVHILRPSLLLGDRSEQRPLESFGQAVAPLLAPLFRGALAPMRPVQADEVAAALIAAAFDPRTGTTVHRWPFQVQSPPGKT